jgi:hypothetical protein
MTKSNVKGLKDAPASVVQDGHARVKIPKLTLDGTPLLVFAFGRNASVAATPAELSRVRLLPPLNPVFAAFVLYVIVAAVALVAAMNIAMPAIEAARTSRLITFILSFFSCCSSRSSRWIYCEG